jgi:hypothetical protein
MVVLTDIALALLILVSAGFLGVTAMALYKEVSKPKKTEDDKNETK